MKLTKNISCKILFIISFLLIACNKVNYNAEIYDRAILWINDDFLKENITEGAHFNDEIADDSYPKTRTYTINNKEYFDIIFSEFATDDIDFDTTEIHLFIFTCIYNGRSYKINKINFDKVKLKIEVKSISPKIGVKDASMPLLRCIAIKMNRLEATSVTIIEKS